MRIISVGIGMCYHELRVPPPFPDVKIKIFSIFCFSLTHMYFEVSSIRWTHFENSNIALKLKKSKRCYVFYVKIANFFSFRRVFPKIKFSIKKVLFRLHFFGMVRAIELKLHSHILDTIWGGYFFYFKKYCSGDF